VLVVGFLSQYAATGRGIDHVLPFAKAGTFVHYADVLANGYTVDNATEFPLLPAMMFGLHQVGMPLAAASMLIVNAAFIVGLVLFAVLGARYVGTAAAIRGATYLAIFPTSHFFSLASTESLMLVTLCGAVLCALRATPRWWLAAAVLAALCALTRPPAVLVGLPLLAIAIGQLRSSTLGKAGIAAALTAGAAVPAAVLGFFLYLDRTTGDFLAAIHAQAQFGRSMSLTGPVTAVTSALRSVAGGTFGPGVELAAACMIVVGIVWFALRAAGDRWELRGWHAFAAASLLMPLATGLVWQMPRFALLIPPLFWALGQLGKRQWLHTTMFVLFPMALAFKVVFEVTGVVQ
jgi:hypothetical protein